MDRGFAVLSVPAFWLYYRTDPPLPSIRKLTEYKIRNLYNVTKKCLKLLTFPFICTMFSKIHRDDKQIVLLSICQLIGAAVEQPETAEHRAGLAEGEQTVGHSVIYCAVGAAEAERVHARLRLRADGGDDGFRAVVRDDGVLMNIVIVRVGEGGDIVLPGLRRVADVQLRGGQAEPEVLQVFPAGGVEAVGVVPGGIEGIDRAVELGEVPGVRDALALVDRFARDRAGGNARAV